MEVYLFKLNIIPIILTLIRLSLQTRLSQPEEVAQGEQEEPVVLVGPGGRRQAKNQAPKDRLAVVVSGEEERLMVKKDPAREIPAQLLLSLILVEQTFVRFFIVLAFGVWLGLQILFYKD